MTTTVTLGAAYRLWIRGRADRDSPKNDSVAVQFSNSIDSAGRPVYRIGTTSATRVALKDCSGCSLSGWGWQDNRSGLNALGPPNFFSHSGPQVIRIQTLEDGMSIDQVVLSPDAYVSSSPGPPTNDATILPEQP